MSHHISYLISIDVYHFGTNNYAGTGINVPHELNESVAELDHDTEYHEYILDVTCGHLITVTAGAG